MQPEPPRRFERTPRIHQTELHWPGLPWGGWQLNDERHAITDVDRGGTWRRTLAPRHDIDAVIAWWRRARSVVTAEWVEDQRATRPRVGVAAGVPVDHPWQVRQPLREIAIARRGHRPASDLCRFGEIRKQFDDTLPPRWWSLDHADLPQRTSRPITYRTGGTYNVDLARRIVSLALVEAFTRRPIRWRSDGTPVHADEADVVVWACRVAGSILDAAIIAEMARAMVAQPHIDVTTTVNQEQIAARFLWRLRLPAYPAIQNHAGLRFDLPGAA